MNTQDKQMDELFRSKLEGFETEPSERVWTGINAELDSAKTRARSIWPLLRIAASVVLLVTAGIILVPWKNNNNQAHRRNYAKLTQPPIKSANKATTVNAEVKPVQPKKNELNGNLAVAARGKSRKARPNTQPPSDNSGSVPLPEPQTLTIAGSPASDIKPTVVAHEIMIREKQLEGPEISKPVLASVQTTGEKPVIKKHGIHNVGDLVNLVVARVDKRKDKVIEFTDNEDDESTITGLNIGPIKIKKDK